MNYTEIQKRHLHISELILNYNISEAINQLLDFAGHTKKQYQHIIAKVGIVEMVTNSSNSSSFLQ